MTDLLPVEVVIHIFTFLNYKEIPPLMLVCENYLKAGKSDYLWKFFFQRNYFKYFLRFDREYRNIRLNTLKEKGTNKKDKSKNFHDFLILEEDSKKKPRKNSLLAIFKESCTSKFNWAKSKKGRKDSFLSPLFNDNLLFWYKKFKGIQKIKFSKVLTTLKIPEKPAEILSIIHLRNGNLLALYVKEIEDLEENSCDLCVWSGGGESPPIIHKDVFKINFEEPFRLYEYPDNSIYVYSFIGGDEKKIRMQAISDPSKTELRTTLIGNKTLKSEWQINGRIDKIVKVGKSVVMIQTQPVGEEIDHVGYPVVNKIYLLYKDTMKSVDFDIKGFSVFRVLSMGSGKILMFGVEYEHSDILKKFIIWSKKKKQTLSQVELNRTIIKRGQRFHTRNFSSGFTCMGEQLDTVTCIRRLKSGKILIATRTAFYIFDPTKKWSKKMALRKQTNLIDNQIREEEIIVLFNGKFCVIDKDNKVMKIHNGETGNFMYDFKLPIDSYTDSTVDGHLVVQLINGKLCVLQDFSLKIINWEI